MFDASVADLIRSAKALRPEGPVAKRLNSRYEAGRRSGAWQQMRVNQGQKFVIGGYRPTAKNFDALIFGYYEDNDLVFSRNEVQNSARVGDSRRSRRVDRFVPIGDGREKAPINPGRDGSFIPEGKHNFVLVRRSHSTLAK